MSNERTISVKSSVLEKALRDAGLVRFHTDSHVAELRALLDAPAALGEIDLTPKRLAHAESVIEKQNNLIASLRAELVESYRVSAQAQGEPVAWRYREGDGTQWRLTDMPPSTWYFDPRQYEVRNLYDRPVPAPVVVSPIQEDRESLIAYGRSCGLDEASTLCSRMAYDAYYPAGSRFKVFTPKAQKALGDLLIKAANKIASLPGGPYERFKARQAKKAEPAKT